MQVFWGVVFNYEQACGASSGSGNGSTGFVSLEAGAASASSSKARPANYEMVQGLEVVWNNEVVDVSLLRLNDEIPAGEREGAACLEGASAELQNCARVQLRCRSSPLPPPLLAPPAGPAARLSTAQLAAH